jgi:glutamate/tyrosine decarboxylase-like PLP-dependent enzyme
MSIQSWNDPEELRRMLESARQAADGFLRSLPTRPVRAEAGIESLRSLLDRPLSEGPARPEETFRDIVASMDTGIVASAGPRYFGFVIGGTLPISLAADWMLSAWDQNPGLYATSPAIAVAEETAAKWVLDLLALPPESGVGFVTGCQMANFTALAAARHEILRREGWNVEENGLQEAPKINVVVSEEAHATIHRALRYLGLGAGRSLRVRADEQGRMDPEDLDRVLAGVEGPLIVCAQAGNVNSGAFDDVARIAAAAHARGGWLHVDGAFGLWAAASPSLRARAAGADQADSWATDAHKWLNVPYDCGIVIVRNAEAHRGSMTVKASYLVQTEGAERDAVDWVPEFSRRGRGFPVYAALRALGRSGVAELIDSNCALARRMGERLARAEGVEILAEIVLNQVLVRFGGSDDATREVIRLVQEEGTCWLAGTTWRGRAAMRISVSNWSTAQRDADESTEAILRAWEAVRNRS